ncbi:hypothetical protein BD311DRAFT_868607 [Dichomitus squalens]|uniref:Uncharacterized protein n=1 Tax=Dichomitus squalens TaxID=114155 RepID=A0A4Q9MCI0_9APHY|nr:hypothetical protein BD311DRAFT_868607 [Dichomitus squalens]
MPGQKMNYNSLTCVRYDLYGLISEFCPHARANKVVRDDWFTQLDKHCQYLRVTLNIPAAPKEDKLYYSKDKMLLLAKTTLANSIHMNNTLQHIVLWTMIFYTAGRPGSYLSTAYYKDWYILYKDIVLIHSEEDPTTFRVDLGCPSLDRT